MPLVYKLLQALPTKIPAQNILQIEVFINNQNIVSNTALDILPIELFIINQKYSQQLV